MGVNSEFLACLPLLRMLLSWLLHLLPMKKKQLEILVETCKYDWVMLGSRKELMDFATRFLILSEL